MLILNCSLISAIFRVVTFSILAIVLTTPCISSPIQGYRCIDDNAATSSVSIARSKGRTVVLTETTAPATIHLVVELFAEDLRALVPSVEAIVRNTSSLRDAESSLNQGDQVIIVGLIDHNVQGLVQEALAASQTPQDNSTVQWESWTIHATQSMKIGDSVHDAVIVTAFNKRGIAYALFTISEEAGVSPWVWWADVPVQSREALWVKSCSHGPPAVKYRGIFLNDESPALTGWANQFFHTGAGSKVPLAQSFTTDFYAKFFELLLRIKANIFWPAMWSDMFAVAGLSTLPNGGKNGSGAAGPNQRLADLYGVIYGTSHEEPMARNTPEFDRFAWNQQWDFAANAKGLEDWWRYGALRAATQETLFTVGMRGKHDSPLQGASSELLERIVEKQRQILSEVQERPVETIPQSWCMYSEVLKYYESENLKVPEDVTILWADDNFGDLRRVPSTEKELDRLGGHGLYYHMDYHGPPRSYQWLSTVNFVKTWEQFNVAQATGINRMLIVNVGDLKPIEVGTELAMSLAYEGTQYVLEQGIAIDKTIELLPWLEEWSQTNFPELDKELVAWVVLSYNAINNRLKPEFLLSTSWSLLMEQEAERIQTEWTHIADVVSILRKSVSTERHAAFEQLVALPALLSANLNSLYIASGRANLYAKQGRASTKAWHEKVLSHFAADQELTKQYHTLSGGKWDRMMGTPHINYQSWDPPKTDSIPNTTSAPLIKPNSSLIVSLEGSATAWSANTTTNCQGECKEPILPPLDRYTYTDRWIDVSSTLVGEQISFAASSSDLWLKLSRVEGSLDAGLSADARISISVDWDKILVPNTSRMIGSVIISSPQDASSISVKVPVDVANIDVTHHTGGYIGANGLVAMHAANSTAREAAADGAAWHSLPGYGMTGNAVTTLPPTHASYTASQGPTLTFDFSIIGGLESVVRNGNISITVYVGLIWNYRPNKPHAFTLQLDKGEAVTVQPVPVATAHGPQPRDIYALGPPDIESVLKKGMRLAQIDCSIGTIEIEQAWHTLTLAAVHPGLVIEMIAIGTIPLGLSLPPRQSFRVP